MKSQKPVELELEQVQVKDGHIVPIPNEDVIIESELQTEGSQGQTCQEYYQVNGVVGRRKKLLDAIRDGQIPVSQISGHIPVQIKRTVHVCCLTRVLPGFTM